MCETSSDLFKHYKAIVLTGDLRPHYLTLVYTHLPVNQRNLPCL